MTCPACGAETADGCLCGTCTGRLLNDLNALPGLLGDLQDAITRQVRIGDRGGKRTDATPLPVNLAAVEVMDVARSTLLAWVLTIEDGDLGGLADDPRAWCRWLVDRIERIRGHAECAMLADEIADVRHVVHRAVDLPPERRYLGVCEVCGADLYAAKGASSVVCGRCQRLTGDAPTIDVEARRSQISASMVDMLAPKSEVLGYVRWRLGIEVPDGTFRSWVSRGVLQAHAGRYRIGDVIALAERLDAKMGRRANGARDRAAI
jgi:hypothetical protein